jgi:SIT family siderophore-iron:H+ symporter-like MFS transporter
MTDEAAPITKRASVVRGTPAEATDTPSNRNLTRGDRIGVFIGVFLIAYAYGLDGTIRSTYQVQHQQSLNLLQRFD